MGFEGNFHTLFSGVDQGQCEQVTFFSIGWRMPLKMSEHQLPNKHVSKGFFGPPLGQGISFKMCRVPSQKPQKSQKQHEPRGMYSYTEETDPTTLTIPQTCMQQIVFDMPYRWNEVWNIFD